MTELIVDRLEAVQIEHAHRERLPAALRAGDGVLEAIIEQAAVGHSGEGVEVGDAIEFVGMRLQATDVGEHCDVMDQLPVFVLDTGDGQGFSENLTVLAAVPHLAAPVATLVQAAPHLGVELVLVAT